MFSLFLLTGLTLGQANAAEPARVTVLLPSQARLYVDGQFCDLTSDTRSFDTPPLERGRKFYYILKAAIERDGRTVEVSKKVFLRAGKRSVVDFGDMSGKETASSPGPDQPASLANHYLIPRGSSPSLHVVRMEGDNLEIMKMVMEWKNRTQTRIVKDKDGKERPVTYTLGVTVFKPVWGQLDPKTVRVFDAEDQVVPAERWEELLGKDKVVLVSDDGQKVNSVYRGIFRKDTLILVRTPRQGYALAPPTVAPPGKKNTQTPPSAALKPRPNPVEGPPPHLCLVRLDDRGNLHIRQCEERPYFTTGMREIKTDAGTRQVPFQAPINVLNVSMMEFPVQQLKVYDTDAQEIAVDELPKLLHREQVVLVARDGKQVDPLYRERMKKGTLILMPSPEIQSFFFFRMGWGRPATAPSPTPSSPKAPPPPPAAPAPPAKAVPAPVVPVQKSVPRVVPPVTPPPPPPAKPKDEFEPSATEQEILDQANAERKKVGAPALSASPLLIRAARQHSANMAKQDNLNHTLDGKGVAERLNRQGYAWSRCGENIASGQRTPAEAIVSWMNSPGHRDNLLGTDYTQIGVAVAATKDGHKYWTMVLARPQ